MKLLKLFAQYATGAFMTLIVGLISTPILTRMISTTEMGKYSMFITIGSLISSILYLGLDQSYVRFYNDEPDHCRVLLLRKCMKFPVMATTVVSFFLLLFYRPFSDMLVGTYSFAVVIVFALYLVGLVVDRFWLLKIRMVKKARAYSLLNVIRKLSNLIFAIALYYLCWGDSFWTLVIAITLAEGVLVMGCLLVENDHRKVNKKKINTPLSEILKYGFPFIFSTTITLVFQSIDKLMLNALADYNQVGLYSGAQNIVNLLTQVQLVFTTFWVPVAYEHYSKDTNDKDFFIKINKIVSYVMLIIAIALLCVKDILILFLGKNYREAVYVFPFLVFMPIMYTISETTVMGINFKKKSGYHVWISLVCALVNTLGNYYLIQYFGAKGAAISTELAYIIFFVMRTVLANKVYPTRFALTRFAVAVAVVYMLAIMASSMNVTPLFLSMALIVIVFISFLYRDVCQYGINLIKAMVKKAVKSSEKYFGRNDKR